MRCCLHPSPALPPLPPRCRLERPPDRPHTHASWFTLAVTRPRPTAAPPLNSPPQVFGLPSLTQLLEAPLPRLLEHEWRWDARFDAAPGRALSSSRHGHVALLGRGNELVRCAAAGDHWACRPQARVGACGRCCRCCWWPRQLPLPRPLGGPAALLTRLAYSRRLTAPHRPAPAPPGSLVLGPQCEGPAPPASLYDWDMAAAANAAAAFKAKHSDGGSEEQ
jgi:hypothetical protein